MVKPASKLDWVTDDSPLKIIEPSAGKKALGFTAEEKPTFQMFNWLFNITDKWRAYFETTTDSHTTSIASLTTNLATEITDRTTAVATKLNKPAGTPTGNEIIGMNAAGSGTEYKTFAATAPFAVQHSGATVTFSMPAAASGQAGYISTGAQDIPGAKNFLANATFAANVVIGGTLEVQGSLTYLNTNDLAIEDNRITLNYGGTTGSASQAGLEVQGTSGVLLTTIQYDSTLASKWKCGASGFESEIVTVATNQVITGRKTGNGYLPAGTVLPFAGSVTPSYFLNCDGAEYSQTTYADLYAAIGNTYNTQINPTTGVAWAAPTAGNFRVPDYRSLFLRGVGTNNLTVATTLGGWQDDATNKNGLSISSVTVGGSNAASSVSGSTTANSTFGMNSNASHSHSISHSTGAGSSGAYVQRQYPINGANDGTSPSTQAVNIDHTHNIPSLTVSGTAAAQIWTQGSGSAVIAAGDLETRPQNRGVNYIIKT